MEISRYASRLAPTSDVLPSGRPLPHNEADTDILSPGSVERNKTIFAASPLEFPRDLPQEPDDARLTGGTRSLSRRLLALNIPTFATIRDSSAKALDKSALQGPRVQKALSTKTGLVA